MWNEEKGVPLQIITNIIGMKGTNKNTQNKTKQLVDNGTKQLVDGIVEGMQARKGHHIRVVDLRKIDDTICQYLVICEGNSPTQVSALADSVEEEVRMKVGEKPIAVHGMNNSIWIAMDYADVLVHVFLPEAREFYDIDHLWEDADITDVEEDL